MMWILFLVLGMAVTGFLAFAGTPAASAVVARYAFTALGLMLVASLATAVHRAGRAGHSPPSPSVGGPSASETKPAAR